MDKKTKMLNIVLKHKFWLGLMLLATIVRAASEVMKASLMGMILNVATAGSGKGFLKVVVFTVFLLLFTLAALIFHSFAFQRFAKKCMVTLKKQWFLEVQKKQLCDYDVQESATYISHFTVDALTIEEDYLGYLFRIMDYVVVGLISFIAILKIHYAFILFVVVTSWIPPLINHLWGGKLAAKKLNSSKMNGKFVTALKEILAGYEVSKLFGLSARMKSVFQKNNSENAQARYESELTGDVASDCSSIASLGIWMGSLLLGAFLAVRGVITVGAILNANQLLNNITNPLYGISYCFARMKAADQLYQEVSADLAKRAETEEGLKAVSKFQHNIALKDICLKQKERTILEHVNLEFQKNKKYLLVGESGSGKSSLIKILLNIYAGYDGKVLIDETDLKKIDKDSWYKRISVVTQDSFVFCDTVYNNITLFQTYPDAEVRRILELCGLSEFATVHQEGLDFVIEENGKNISGGERQRICLARALLRNPSILILDEATSALNPELAQQVERNILNLKETTVISISHRVFPELEKCYDSTLRFANHVVE